MELLLHALASDSWVHIVRALLHTLWLGGIITLLLWLVLRRTTDPTARYRWCMSALVTLLLSGLVAWAVIRQQSVQRSANQFVAAGAITESISAPLPATSDRPSSFQTLPSLLSKPPRTAQWVPRLSLAWLIGMTLMLVRAGWMVASAERLRRSAQPLTAPDITSLLAAAKSRLGIVKKIRLAITDRLTSPAVVGIVCPTLIFPLSLVTTLPMEQIELILLHELAHIRRGDYLVNLLQLVAESILFFNPAVWWISRQIRHEREACCDLVATTATGTSFEYARVLAQVAQASIEPQPEAAMAFGKERGGSGLRDRIQRLLVPGYFPAARLTWQALLGSLFLGGALIILSAAGTRWTVAAAAKLLTPQERIERIEGNLTRLRQNPADAAREREEVEVKVRLVGISGEPLPGIDATFTCLNRGGSINISRRSDKDGICSTPIRRGDVFITTQSKNLAPAQLGPIDTRTTNELRDLELVLVPGFDATIKAIDSETGAPIPNATFATAFRVSSGGSTVTFNAREHPANADGTATLPHWGSFAFNVALKANGYEITEKQFQDVKPGEPLVMAARRALSTSGTITDKLTGDPIGAASIYIFHGKDAPPGITGVDPKNPGTPFAVTDAQGHFTIDRLPRRGQYWLLVDSPGHASGMIPEVTAGKTNLQLALGPELRVRGQITGDLSLLPLVKNKPVITFSTEFRAVDKGSINSHVVGTQSPVEVRDGRGYFDFTNKIAGPVAIQIGDRGFRRNVTAPIDDWLIDLSGVVQAPKTRSVLVKFAHPSGVAPRGSISVSLPSPEPNTYERKQIEIQDGEIRFDGIVGRDFQCEPAALIGYWFAPTNVLKIPDQPGPFKVTIPVIPAGAIYVQARNSDGSIATNTSFSVIEITRSPLLQRQWQGGDSQPARRDPSLGFVANAIPLGGTYRVMARRGHNVALSEPITLTEAAPDPAVDLRFPKGTTVTGVVRLPSGEPLEAAEIETSWETSSNHQSYGFGLPSVLTDGSGHFQIKDVNPSVGEYYLKLQHSGTRTVRVPIDFQKLPMAIDLKPGLRLAGRLVESKSGRPLLSTELRAYHIAGKYPGATARTDQKGRFEFTTLSEGEFRIAVDGAYFPEGGPVINPVESTNDLLLEVTLANGSDVALGER